MKVLPMPICLNDANISSHVEVGLHLTQLREGVADDHAISTGKSFAGHLLTPAVRITNAGWVKFVPTIDFKEHISFIVFETVGRQLPGDG